MNDIIISVLNQVILWKTLRQAAMQSKADNLFTAKQLEAFTSIIQPKNLYDPHK